MADSALIEMVKTVTVVHSPKNLLILQLRFASMRAIVLLCRSRGDACAKSSIVADDALRVKGSRSRAIR